MDGMNERNNVRVPLQVVIEIAVEWCEEHGFQFVES